MGLFTWTDANKTPRKTKSGDYYAADKIKYDGYAKVICPDNTVIEEPCYEGYGIFNNKDVYELVVDWNKPYLTGIFRKLEKRDLYWYQLQLKTLAELYQADDSEGVKAEIQRLINEHQRHPAFKDSWKRSIGVV